MKTLLLACSIILSAFVPFISQAQYNFPLNELQKLANKNANDFETVMLEKDYTFQSKPSTKELKTYTSDKKGADGKQNIVTRFQVPNAMAKVTFTSTDKKYYLGLKSQMAASGLKFVNEETRTIDGVQAECKNFANGGLKVSLLIYTTDVIWYRAEVHF